MPQTYLQMLLVTYVYLLHIYIYIHNYICSEMLKSWSLTGEPARQLSSRRIMRSTVARNGQQLLDFVNKTGEHETLRIRINIQVRAHMSYSQDSG